MISLKKRDQGFTIIELLIVIVVIGILAALVLNSFSGVQARARDTERKSDINAIRSQLEVYYNDNGGYPSEADLVAQTNGDFTWAATNLPGFELEALVDPRGNVVNAAGGTYTYEALPADCDTGECDSFTLSADLESSTPDPYTKESLNQ